MSSSSSRRKNYSGQPRTISDVGRYNNNHNNNTSTTIPFRSSPEPYGDSANNKFYGQYITDASSEEDEYDRETDIIFNQQQYSKSSDFMAMPPPIKKRKLTADHYGSGPTNIGYTVKPPTSITNRPTKMDIIREQIGLAMNIYHFNVDKLAKYCDTPRQVFVKWLQGGIDQAPNIGVNADKNNNNKDKSDKSEKHKKSSKATILKIKFKRSKIKKEPKEREQNYYLTAILANQIAEKMQIWLDEFIMNGFMDKKYLKFVHHFERYKRNEKGIKHETHVFDNLDMKFNKIKMEDNQFMNDMNNNPKFDWNDDSSFYYKANNENNNDTQISDDLIPIRIEDQIAGKPITDSFLWDPSLVFSISVLVQG